MLEEIKDFYNGGYKRFGPSLGAVAIINTIIFWGSLNTSFTYNIRGIQFSFLIPVGIVLLIWFILGPFNYYRKNYNNEVFFSDKTQTLILKCSEKPMYKQLNKLLLISGKSVLEYSFKITFGEKKRKKIEKAKKYNIKFKKSSKILLSPSDTSNSNQIWIKDKQEPYLECNYDMESELFLSFKISTKLENKGNIKDHIDIYFEFDGKKDPLYKEKLEIV